MEEGRSAEAIAGRQSSEHYACMREGGWEESRVSEEGCVRLGGVPVGDSLLCAGETVFILMAATCIS